MSTSPPPGTTVDVTVDTAVDPAAGPGVDRAVGPVGDRPVGMLAALAAVLHRRTLQDPVRLGYTGPGGPGAVLVELAGDPTFAELAGRVATAARPVPPGARFDLPAGGGLAGQVRRAYAAGTAEPDRRVAVLDLASPEERALVARWGRGAPPAPPACVHELVQRQARLTPDAPAVGCQGEWLSYRQLDERAGRLAGAVTARLVGGRPDQVVAVLAERSVDLVVSLLAVLKAGAAYLALDPQLPPARLGYLLRDAAPRLVLVQSRLREGLATAAAGDVPALVMDGPATSHLDGHPGSIVAGPSRSTVVGSSESALDGPPAATLVGPDDLAYICYTSGSTGEPRGVCVPHAAVSRLVREPDWARPRQQDVYLQLAPVAFDASVFEIWAPLTTGARLVVYPPGPVTPAAVAAAIRAERVTVLWLTASLFHQMVTDHVEAFTGVRHLLAGGEVVSPERVAQLLARCPHLLFTNGYGPTENTVFTTCWGTDAARFTPTGSLPIGRPVRGTDIAILDPAGQPVPPGVVGELYAAGAGLARGYLNRPAATAERFVDGPHGRRYRTGDLARWLPGGIVGFCGRADRQLKVHGYRIEPGEIEEAIRRQPDVRQATVLAQPDGAGGTRLLAYVTPESVDAVALTRALRATLPGYLVPWAVRALPDLPLNRNGKLDRSALPAVGRAPRTLATPYQPPAPGLPARLAALWGEVLAVEPVGAGDDFFDLGGHSLLAAELVRRLRRQLAADLPMETVHLYPTVAALAAALAAQEEKVTAQLTTARTLTDGERAFVDRVGRHYANDGFPLDSGRVLGWMIISDPPEQRATEIAERLGVSRATVDAVADQLVPATLLSRRDSGDGEYYLSLRDDAWPRVVSHTFAGWPRLHQILQDGVAALAGEPATRSARVRSMESLFAYLVTELPGMMRRWEERESGGTAS